MKEIKVGDMVVGGKYYTESGLSFIIDYIEISIVNHNLRRLHYTRENNYEYYNTIHKNMIVYKKLLKFGH